MAGHSMAVHAGTGYADTWHDIYGCISPCHDRTVQYMTRYGNAGQDMAWHEHGTTRHDMTTHGGFERPIAVKCEVEKYTSNKIVEVE